tara:strand:- start:330 stop:1721 length:1392 start_codon:yes stop_codon:yes gene_type:complete
MEFFNRKEEVIDIQITQYGKHLLSKGKFRPTFYAFFDDDILYDMGFAASGSELQKEIEDRIKSTPRMKAQYSFSGRDLKTSKIDNPGICERRMNTPACSKMQVSKEKNYALGVPMGTSSPTRAKKPAWSVQPLGNSPVNQVTLSGSLYYQEAKREKVRFTFVSDTISDYVNTDTVRNKYIDLHSVDKEIYRIYFWSTKPYPPSGGTGVNLVPIDISGVSDGSAGTTAETVSKNFATEGVKKLPLNSNAKKVFLSPDASDTSKDTKLVINSKFGSVKKHAVAAGLSGIVTMAQLVQGRAGIPQYVTIPQLDYEIETNVTIGNTDELGSAGDMPAPWSNDQPLFPDGTYLLANSQQLALEIQEAHAPMAYENFDVEVFEVLEDENGIEELRPLYFQKPMMEVVDGILLTDEEQEAQFELADVTPDTVSYFFDLAFDSEIGINLENFRRPDIEIYDVDPNNEEGCS